MSDDPASGLDPADWDAFRADAHALLDAAIDRMEHAREGRVWTPFPPEMKAAFDQPLPEAGLGAAELSAQAETLRQVMAFFTLASPDATSAHGTVSADAAPAVFVPMMAQTPEPSEAVLRRVA